MMCNRSHFHLAQNLTFLLCLLMITAFALKPMQVSAIPHSHEISHEDDFPNKKDVKVKGLKFGYYNSVVNASGAKVILLPEDRSNIVKLYERSPGQDFTFEVYVKDNTLYIQSRPHNKLRIRKCRVLVPAANVSFVKVGGTGDVIAKQDMHVPDFRFNISGTGDVKLQNIKTDRDLIVEISGTGDFEAGDITASRLIARSTGTGDIESHTTAKAGYVEIETRGTGDITFPRLHADKAYVTTTGTGDVKLDGDATYAKLYCAGTGSIKAEKFVVKTLDVHKTSVGSICCTAHKVSQLHTAGVGSVIIRNPEKP